MITHATEGNEVEKLMSLIETGDVCMFAMVDHNNQINSRPMATVAIDEQGTIWFFTNTVSDKIHEVSHENVVNLIYSNTSRNSYVDVKGHCVVIVDHDKSKLYWNPALEKWFPSGLNDARLCLLKVIPEEVHYWTGGAGIMEYGIHRIKALILNTPYEETTQGTIVL